MKQMKQVAEKEVKSHEKRMHATMGKKPFAKGGKVRGTGCATKGKKFSGAY